MAQYPALAHRNKEDKYASRQQRLIAALDYLSSVVSLRDFVLRDTLSAEK